MNVNNNAPIDMLSMRRPGNVMTADQRKLAAMAKLAGNGKSNGLNRPESLGNTAPMSRKALISMAGAASSQGLGISQGEANPLSVKGLMESWGKNDARYDLDGDGTVGMTDLVELLSRMAAGAETVPATPVENDVTPSNAAAGMPSLGDQATVAPPEAPVDPGQMSVDGLMEAWGEKGSRYDLDGNGTVGMQDLVALLSRLGAAQGESQTGDEVVTTPNTGNAAAEQYSLSNALTDTPGEEPVADGPLTVKGLMEAWGEKGSRFDLDGNGTVGMQDLIALLSRLGAAQGESETGDEVVATPNTGNAAAEQFSLSNALTDTPGEEPVANGPLTVKGLMEAWGEKGSRYDLDGNGTVGMQDLIALLSKLGGADGQNEAPIPQIIAAVGTPTNRAPHAGRAVPMQRIADSLFSRLQQGGFGQSPPTNIHKLVAGLDLSPSREQSLLNHLSSQYPNGLGVNFVG